MTLIPDEQIHPVATGKAAELVAQHQEPAAIQFFSGWFCPFVRRVWIALEEKKLPYQYHEVNPYKKEESFLKINPRGLVPAYVVNNDTPLYESIVLMEYLEDAFPQSTPLLPQDPVDRARVRLWIDHISRKIIPNFFRLLQAQEDHDQNEARKDLEKAIYQFSEQLKSPYFMGEQFGMVDIALVPFIQRQYVVVQDHRGFIVPTDGEVWQKWHRWVEAINERASVQNTMSEAEYYAPIIQRYLNNTAQSDMAKATRQGKGQNIA